MRVLVACEFSGIVRDAFIERGHDAVSLDLLPSERPGPHIQRDAISYLDELSNGLPRYDLIIAHPPCTYLANSGIRWLYGGKGDTPDPERWAAMEEAAWFFGRMLTAPAVRVAVENPVMHGHATRRIRHGVVRHDGQKPWDTIQTVQPWQFGHGETKATRLWLRNLPPLRPTSIVPEREPRVHYASPGPDRWKERSRTLPGIAAAMADQWGNVLDLGLTA